MRIHDDLRRCVVFVGVEDATPGNGGIRCIGTAFLISYRGYGYLVTAKHVALPLGDAPFLIRMNQKAGGAVNVPIDLLEAGAHWQFSDDPDVDLAALSFAGDLPKRGFDVRYLSEAHFSRTAELEASIEAGDFCYAIGLFRLMQGEKRNLPVVHTGNIALMPGDEKIRVQDWDVPLGNRVRHIEGYLVEAQSLQGLSGSPVLARSSFPLGVMTTKGSKELMVNSLSLELMGVWQGAWDAPPDELLAADRGNQLRVPVGMGVVVPASKLKGILDCPEFTEQRRRARAASQAATAATNDAVPLSGGLSSTDENPTHREDFTSLLNVAAKTRPQDD